MNSPIFRRLTPFLCALCLLAGATCPALAAREAVPVHIDGRPLNSDTASFIDDDTTYVPLAAFARAMGRCSAAWEEGAARITAPGLSVSAVPGQPWVEANGRCLYVPGGVRMVSDRVMVPLRTMAQIYGVRAVWDDATGGPSVASSGARPLEPGERFYPTEDLYWLSRIISAESRGEPLEGQIAVGNVVLNRVKSPLCPNTIKEVIFETSAGVAQFEPVTNGTVYLEPTASSVRAAKLCLEGASVVEDCMFFFAPALSAGTWIVNNCTYHTTIGCHQFYK